MECVQCEFHVISLRQTDKHTCAHSAGATKSTNMEQATILGTHEIEIDKEKEREKTR